MIRDTYADISSHNGTPDLRAYWNDGHRTLCLKATEGTGYAWQQMQALAQQWHSFGPDAQCIYYHWLYGTFTGQQQFAWFWSHVQPVFRAGDWLMTDFEDVDPSRWVSDAVHLQVVREFNALGDQRAPVMDYAPNWYLANLPLCIAYFKTRQLWVPSDYSHDPPLNPYGLSPAAHQFTDRATVAGFAAPVDYNRWIVPPTTGDDVTPADIQAIADAVMAKLLLSDGPLRSPSDAADHATNPNWAWQTHIEATTAASRAGNTNAHAALIAAQAAQATSAAALAAAANAAKAITSTDPAAPGVLARVAALQAQVVALQAQVVKLSTITGTGGPVDLAAVTEAARAGATAGASLDGKTLTIHDGSTA